MRAYENRHTDNKIQRTKDRRAMIWRMEEEEEERERIQKKSSPEIGAPGDKYEQEADAVAQKVMSGTAQPHSFSDAGTTVQPEQETPGMLMAKSKDGKLQGTEQLQAKLDSSKGGGTSLDASTQSEIGGKMGADLSGVKVHTDSNAAEMAEGINAKAFTHGQDIYFNKGNFDTASAEGKGLLAHELAHTQQQKNGLQRKIQRAMKFEFQTGNYVWAVKNKGAPDPLLLPRRYTGTTVGYKEGAGEENGDKPAYLTTGKNGDPARAKGERFVEAEGPAVMKKAKDADPLLPAQFVKSYKFTQQADIADILDKPVAKGQLELVSEIDNSVLGNGNYNPNTFEFRYFNKDDVQMTDSTLLPIHLNEEKIFKKHHVAYMKVGKGDKKGIDKDKKAQYQQVYKVTIDPNGKVKYLGQLAIIKQVGKTTDNSVAWEKERSKNPKAEKNYNPGTYDKQYFISGDFEGDVLKPNVTPLDVHLSKDETTLKEGSVKFMEKKKLPRADQTAMELQSEHGGFLEFETPKWFDDWNDLKLRIQDAVDITNAMNAQRGTPNEVTDTAITNVINPKNIGSVVEWPAAYSTAHLTNLITDGRRLLVHIVDDTWTAKIQSSHEASLSQYSSLLTDHDQWAGVDFAALTLSNADLIYNTAFDEAKALTTTELSALKLSKLNLKDVQKPDLANLKGMIQIITNYLIHGQYEQLASNPAKDIAQVLSRTSFYSMYHSILSETERLLFNYIVSKQTITKLLEAPINKLFSDNSRTETVAIGFATGDAYVYKTGHQKGKGPKINEWLKSIISGYKVDDKQIQSDKLSPIDTGSKAMGAHKAGAETGEENIARFEVRYSTTLFGGQEQPASNWVNYAQQLFQRTAGRGDTPDNPITPDINEAAKTGLKNSP